MDPPTALKNDNVDDKPTAELLEMGVAPVDFRPAGKGRPAHYVEIDPAAEKKLLLKLDLILLPVRSVLMKSGSTTGIEKLKCRFIGHRS